MLATFSGVQSFVLKLMWEWFRHDFKHHPLLQLRLKHSPYLLFVYSAFRKINGSMQHKPDDFLIQGFVVIIFLTFLKIDFFDMEDIMRKERSKRKTAVVSAGCHRLLRT